MSIQGVKSIIPIVVGFWILISIVVGFWIFIAWHTAYGDYAACFNSQKDYKHFLIDIGDRNDYLVKFPCPTNENLLNQTFPDDESGK